MVLAFELLLSLLMWAGDTLAQDNQSTTGESMYFEAIITRALPRGYPSQMPPEDNLPINVTFLFFSLSQVLFANMEIEVEFFFLAVWQDKRFNSTFFEKNDEMKKLTQFEVPLNAADRLWIPKIAFPSCKHCGLGLVTGEPHILSFHWQAKTLRMHLRATMKFACTFDLSYYPFDSHKCSVYIQLMDYVHGVKLKLKNSLFLNVETDHFVQSGMPPEFQLQSVGVEQVCSSKSLVLKVPNDICLTHTIQFKRIPSYHIMLVYCPTVLIILISWISFWLPIESSAPRISLGMTSLLTMTTQFANEQKNLPPVAYVKGLDVWMIMCVFIIFASLIEFTLAHIFRYPKHHVQPIKPVEENQKLNLEPPLSGINKQRTQALANLEAKKKLHHPKICYTEKEVNWLDAKARIVFPLFFLVFNVIYWPCFTTGNG